MIRTAASLILQASQIVVGPNGDYPSLTEALAAAGPGDTIRVTAGVYQERPIVSQRLTLLGEPGAIIDGGGDRTVLTITAPATITGFVIRGSGDNQSQEHAGILATGAHGLRVEGNRFEDVLFGVYLKQSDTAIIRNNEIEGKDVDLPLRGDGIRLWYSHGGTISGNVVRRSRDIVIWFSNETVVSDNKVLDSRYGLHYMYSNHNRFERNEFVHNLVGAFLMYSNNITFRDNLFADATGSSGRGLGFKDTDSVLAEGNTLVRNALGISIDNSPHTAGVQNVFRNNVVAFNDVGVSLLPSVRMNVFHDNAFVGNVTPVAVTGGGTALANQWSGNHWSSYAGFDRDRDGHGDTPFQYERLADDVLAKHDDLRLFSLGPATASLNTISRVLPLLKPTPLVIDSSPRIQWVAPHAPRETGPTPSVAAAAAMMAAALLAGAVALRLSRPFRSDT